MADNKLEEWLEQYFDEVSPLEFYRSVFPAGELDVKDGYTKGKYTGIAIEVTSKEKGKPKINRYTITDDLETVQQLTESNNFCLCSPISYCGKKRTAEHARVLYAVAVDLDKIREEDGRPIGLIDLWNGHIQEVGRIPKPTYIVSSGTGLHLYYIFDNGIALFQDTAKQLQELKRELTRLTWNEGIVSIKSYKEIQQEGIYQGFRMPGTITKSGSRARAFETGEKVTIDYLNSFVKEQYQVKRHANYSKLTLKDAKEKYPEWYERRIEKQEPRGSWHTSRKVYDWWKQKITEEVQLGHRYYCLMTLAMYAQKCSMYDAKHNPEPVTREELEKDCFELMTRFELLTREDKNHFNESDVLDALEAYDQKWITYPRKSIEYRSGIPIPANKRNGRKQKDHLKRARAVQMVDYPEGEWKGRKSKREIVEQWQRSNQGKRKADCIRETGLDKKTVYKHWKG